VGFNFCPYATLSTLQQGNGVACEAGYASDVS